MTGIAGIVSLSPGTELKPHACEHLLSGIEYRGPDGLTKWQDHTTFLVHAHLAALPSPSHNLVRSDTPLRCTGDIRLDNRRELAALCDIHGPDLPTDVELVLAAYARFGPECCTHFIGDFAFAIWDSTKSELFCARDPFGVRPFYYRHDDTSFAFASDETALGADSFDLGDEIQVADFLAGMVDYGEKTRHPGIKRLLGGHWLKCSEAGIEISQYWQLKPATSHGDRTAEFKTLFEQAVADRLYGTDAVATFLSGGLDSSSIAVVLGAERQTAGALAPGTFSFVYPTGSHMDESPYIDAVLNAGHFDPHKQLIQDHAPLKGMQDMLNDQKGPVIAPGMVKSRQLYPVAQATGAKVILDGHGGDEVIGYGSYRLIDMARKSQWLRLLPVLHTHCQLLEESRLSVWLDLYRSHGPKSKMARILRKLATRLDRWRTPKADTKGPVWREVLDADYLARTDLIERYKALALMPEDILEDEVAFNSWPILSHMMQSSFEVLDKASAVAGIEARYPFFDTRLVAFCTGLPSSEKLRFGQTRSILRRALKGLLPDKVRLRPDKTSFHLEIIDGLRNHHDDILQEMERDPHNILKPYVNSTALHKLTDQLRQKDADFSGGDAVFLWRLSSFYIWRKSALEVERDK